MTIYLLFVTANEDDAIGVGNGYSTDNSLDIHEYKTLMEFNATELKNIYLSVVPQRTYSTVYSAKDYSPEFKRCKNYLGYSDSLSA